MTYGFGNICVMFLFVQQCSVSALYCTGFAESITDTIGWTNPWAIRGTAAVTLLVLVGINLAGKSDGNVGYMNCENIRMNRM